MKTLLFALALAIAVLGGTVALSYSASTPAHACEGNNC
jgi:hypothetical protein